MKYLEELSNGDTFSLKDKLYLLTCDFKSDGQRLCYSLNDGFPCWLKNQTIIEHNPVYTLDKENNITPVKATPKTDAIN